MLNNWSEFIQKLKDAKKTGKNKGLSVPCITNLLYAGAFDGMISDRLAVGKSKTRVYHELFEEVRIALKSKANLPNKKKGESIGLSSVQVDLQLALWRQQINPLSSFDLLGAYAEQLKLRGFSRDTRPDTTSYNRKNEENQTMDILLPDWGTVFKHYGTRYWELLTQKNSAYRLVFFGVVVEANTIKWANGTKEMLKFKLYLGKEVTDEVVCWPDAGTSEVKEYYKASIKPGAMGLFYVKPSFYQNRRGATLLEFDMVGGRTSV